MLEGILDDKVSANHAIGKQILDLSIDYFELSKKQQEVSSKWKKMTTEGDNCRPSLQEFEKQNGVENLKDPRLAPAKNYSLLRIEASKRLEARDDFILLPLDAIDFDDSTLELAENLENTQDIRELYKLRKKTTGDSKNAGINDEEAARLKNCFSQGRELYISGRNGSMMVKPLNFFYAVTAYSYGIIVLNNPLRYNKGNLPGSHVIAHVPAARGITMEPGRRFRQG